MKKEAYFRDLEKVSDLTKEPLSVLADLHYTHYYLMDRYKKLLAPFDLTPAQSNVLGVVNHFGPGAATLEDIKSLVLEPNADVSRTIDRLVEKGFVKKVINAGNKRKRDIKVTDLGKKTNDRLISEKLFNQFVEHFSARQLRDFVTTLSMFRKTK